ncbi:Tetratricopeptide repeat protein 28 [Stylophora pistillata]|uniref:Tetratricopeptide repeat protein 28 n=1 Tax=Stylophora pistillata TaxID=50429 RepID=A0A2B4RJF5_STYPI|nr:Tetratricopeptide repeat protein 28 [Stylophora pistillata]
MNSTEEAITKVICIGLVVASFLFNTSRASQANELFKECLTVLKNQALIIDSLWANTMFHTIYRAIFHAHDYMKDYASKEEFLREILLNQVSDGTILKGWLNIILAETLRLQNKLMEARKYYESAAKIMKKIGNTPGEAQCYTSLTTLFHSLGQYDKAREYQEKALAISIEIGDRDEEGRSYANLGVWFQSLSQYDKAREYQEKALAIRIEIGDRDGEARSNANLGTLFRSLSQYDKAREHQEKALAIKIEIGDRNGEATSYGNLGALFQSLGQYDKAREYEEKALAIKIEFGDRNGEATSYGNLGTLFQSLGQYDKAREYQEKALAIRIEIGDRDGQAKSHGNLAILFRSVGQYDRAREYQAKALAIQIGIGDRYGEARGYGNLGVLFQLLGQYDKAREYIEKALVINIEIGDRDGEATSYGDLGVLFQSLVKYDKAREYQEKALAIRIEINDRDGEATSYGNLGALFQSLGQYDRAREYEEKALAIQIEIGDRNGEATSYGNLGTLFHSLGTSYGNLGALFQSLRQYDKAREYQEKALAIKIETGDRKGEATSYWNLGTLFRSLGQCEKAREYLEKALAIQIEVGDRNGEARSYGYLGALFRTLGQHKKSQECQEKALAIRIEIGNRHGEATSYANLGRLFQSLGQYGKALEYYEKALAIQIEIGDRDGEATSYRDLGTLFLFLGEYDKAKVYLDDALRLIKRIGDRNEEAILYGKLTALFLSLGKYAKADYYLKEAMAIRGDTGDRTGEAVDYRHLGIISHQCGLYDKAQEYHEKSLAILLEIGYTEGVPTSYIELGLHFQSLGNYDRAEECYNKALQLSKDIGQNLAEFQCLFCLSLLKLSQCHFEEASRYLFLSIEKFDTLRGSLKGNDQLQISMLEEHGNFPYKFFSELLSSSGKSQEALYVEELRRARGLADLMAARYSFQEKISGNPHSWRGIQEIIRREADCACLYTSVGQKHVRFWILKAMGAIIFTKKKVSLKSNVETGLFPDLDQFFKESLWSLVISLEEKCEDRSLDDTELMPLQYDNRAVLRDHNSKDFKTNLHLYYKIIMAPVASLLKEPEIIIVPDSCMYQVPFSALADEGGKYLSETYRIRMVPSLTTLKCVQNSPPDYHSQTGALIVGDPEVGAVIYKERRRTITPMLCARKEAEMIGKLLGVTPLIGKSATKHAVLQAINSVSLIHIAAHGDAERGEIALSPEHPTLLPPFPHEEDYLLTMADISKTRLRAKLVVLSCCHSARGQVRTEGVIGIARAFLGSGARSVLAARWALNDTATEQFMTCFYKYLYRGESASESLRKARNWMRQNGFDKVSQWAPFMLLGDNVTFDFANWPVPPAPQEPEAE